jgi:hypothetical protein
MNEYLLTFELHNDEKTKEVAIHGNPEGLENLAHALLKLVKNTKEGHSNHEHLMSEQWGGTELTSEPQAEESELINHVKVHCWKGSEFQS